MITMDGGTSPVIANPCPQQLSGTPDTPSGKSRRSWFSITPHKVVVPKQDEDLPVLQLTHFTKKVMVCFDKVRLGSSKTCQLSIENPFDYAQELVVEKFPHKKGFIIPEDRWEFDELEHRILPITWTPSEAGNVRELVTFKCDGAFRLQVILLGTAEDKSQKGKRRRGTLLLKKSNGTITKAPGKVGPRRLQQSNGPSRVNQQPRAEQRISGPAKTKPMQVSSKENIRKLKEPNMLKEVLNPARQTMIISKKPLQKQVIGKENIPDIMKPGMLKDVQDPSRQTMIITKKPCSPQRSPLQERNSLSPFKPLDSSLAEITNTTSPDTESHTKRDTLSLCDGMSPLLQTSFVYSGDMDVPEVADVRQELFNDSLDVAPPIPLQNEDESKSAMTKTPVVEGETNVKRLSKEAQATVTKDKAPSVTPPMRRQSRRALFDDDDAPTCNYIDQKVVDEKCDRNSHSNTQEDELEQISKLEVQNNVTEVLDRPDSGSDGHSSPESAIPSSSILSIASLPAEPNNLFPVHESTARKKLVGKRLSDPKNLSPVSQMIKLSPEHNGKAPSPTVSLTSIPSPTKSEADLFPVHESVVTKNLTNKRKSDPKKPETVSHKRMRPQLTTIARKPAVTKKQPVPTATAKKPVSSSKNPRASFEPNRGMTRTMMLRRAAAGVTANVSKPKTAKAKKPVKGVPMAKLNLLKPNRTALPRHPMPFAAKNMFYDERWMEKQEQGFTRWLNYVLTPDDCPSDPSCKATKIDAGALFVEANQQITVALAPSKEDLSLRAYTARRKLNRLRRSACLLFQSEPIIRVIQKVEYEVERSGLKVRTDRKIHADYGIKQKLLNMFLSYNPLWLRIGLETVFGEILPIQSNTDILGLSRFVVQRLLWNPDIAQKYAHPTVPGLYGPGYDKTLCQFTLKKFLLLVFFLDRAKLTRLIDHDPCLFCKDSEYKSSRSMLLEFSRDYLQGEGDVTKHLSYYGYVVTHKQTALDEFDFAVDKLSTALRCGVRLARVVELLTHNWKLSRELRVPAISRLQKIHNTDVALKALKEHGIDVEGGGVNTRAIVDGHREKTLELLWRIIFHFQVEVMLNENQIKEEIAFLKKNFKLQRDLTAIEMTLGSTEGTLGLTRDRSRDSVEPNMYFKSQRLSLLLQWCQAVCHFYGLKVENFTVSFSDGRALCYLVHHYHPSLIPLDAIKQDTTQTQYQRTESPSKSDADDSFDGTWANAYSPSTGKPGEYDRLLANERHNYKMLYENVRELGGIPMMIKSTEMVNTIPDEKVVIVYISYLCARLLDLRTETRAARAIQLKWRAYRLRKRLKERQVQITAAKKIQGAIHDFLTRRRHARIMGSVIKMQALLRGKIARKEAQRLRHQILERREQDASIVIQRHIKGLLQQKRYQRLKASTQLLQAAIRGHLVRRHLNRQHQAARVIQVHYKASKLMQQTRSHYLNMKSAAITLQSVYRGHAARMVVCRIKAARIIQAQWRGYVTRRAYSIKKYSAITIQAWYRMCMVRQEYLEIRRSTLVLQRHIRAYLIRKHQKEAATSMQAVVRGFLVRQQIKKMNRSAVCIQSTFRAYIMQKRYKQWKQAAVLIQTYWRATLVAQEQCKSYQISKGACVTVQACVRGFLVRQHLRKMHGAATCIQASYRAHRDFAHYQQMKKSAVVLQTFWRATLSMKQQARDYQITRGKVITIQALARGFLVRQQVKKMHLAATCIQANYRAHRIYTHYQQMKKSAVVLQTYWRATSEMKQHVRDYQITKGKVITIQALARGFLVRQKVNKMHLAATFIQTNYRAHREKVHYQQMKKSAVVLQTYWRATSEMKQQFRDYQITKGKVITVQALARGFLVRQQVKKMHLAATCIQANYRAHRECSHYKKLKMSAMVLQTYWRCRVEMKQQRTQYQMTQGAVITIQAWVRGFLVRQEMKKRHLAAACIQANYRAHRESSHYKLLKMSTMVLQTYWRSTMEMRQQRQQFQITRGAVITIQALVRGFLVRQELKKHNAAAVCIQANYRAHIAQALYQKTCQASMTLQTYWKATLVARKQAEEYQTTRQACIVIQAHVRGLLVRKEVQKMHEAATSIQTNFRAHKAYREYHKLKQSAQVLQVYWRATLSAKQQMKEYQRIRSAAIMVQAWVRGHNVRQEIKKMNVAATCIQCNFRAHRDFTAYRKMRDSAKTIQVYWRATLLARRQCIDYKITKGACITLQAWVRGILARRHMEQIHTAATCIQSHFRGYQAHTHYQEMKKAASVLQTYWRAVLSAREQHRNYTLMKRAAIIIQAAFRGRQARQVVCRERAARTIQATFRMYTERSAYLEKKEAAIVIQAKYRAHHALQSYLRLKGSAIVIQTYYRGLQQTRQLQAQYAHTRDCVIKIQNTYRMFVTRRSYVEKQKAAITIQAEYRAHRACREYQMKRQAAITIQNYYRGVLLTRQTKSSYSSMKKAAIMIQAKYRMCIQRRRYLKLKHAATVLQAYARGKAACSEYKRMKHAAVVIQTIYRATCEARREQVEYQCTRGAIITIQAMYRGYQVRKQLQQMQEAAKILQVYWRATLQAKNVRQEYETTKKACITLQAAVRGYLVRRQVQKMHLAATCIQANYRAHREACQYQRIKQAANCLQTYWRATLMMKEHVREYENTRQACITIQSFVRGYLVRKQVKVMNSAAVCIQKNYRAHHDSKRYHQMRQSAIVLQKYWRATLAARQETKTYQTTKGAVITIQAYVRGSMVRRQFEKMNCAAVCIQSNFRAFVGQKHYMKKKKAVQTIQMYWRAILIARQQTRSFQISKGACITIQAWLRGCLVRQHVKKMHLAATCIQANYRAHRSYSHYQQMKKSTVVLQTYWRATLSMKLEAREYQITRGKVITVQALARGFLVRQHVKKMHQAATCIQANYRAHCSYTHYQQMKKSAVVLQMYWRATLSMKEEARDYQMTRGKVITIQALARGFLVRQQVKKMHQAATCIQANYRAHRSYTHYQQMKKWAVVLQTYWRATLSMKQEAREYQITRGKVITIQALARGFLVRQQVKKMHLAATCIQANYRAHRSYSHYQQMKKSAVVLQTYWRATSEMKQQVRDYQMTKGKVITIQALARGFLVRQQVNKMHQAATCIQANYREHREKTHYQQMKKSAVVLQTYWRATSEMKQQFRDYQITKDKVITVQALARGFLVRQQVKKMHLAATCIQANYRAHRECSHYQRLKTSTIILQTHWRCRMAMKQYQITQGALITIQSCVRGFLVRQQLKKHNAAATCIQANFRAHLASKSYQKTKEAAIVVQKYWRAKKLAKRLTEEYHVVRESCIVVQAHVRGFLLRQHLRRMHSAATCIQANYRARLLARRYQMMKQSVEVLQTYWRATLLAREHARQYQTTRGAIITVQALVRGYLVRQQMMKMNAAAVCIQCNFRAHRDFISYQKMRDSAKTIQVYWRATLLARRQCINYQTTKGACITLQAWVRGILARRHLEQMHTAATCIQSHFRGYQTRTHYQEMKKAALVLQTRWRAELVCREQEKSYGELRKAAVVIQAVFRGKQARHCAHQQRSARTIQATYRMHIARQTYLKKRQAAILIQANYRAHIANQEYNRIRCAAVKIQQYYRALLKMKEVRQEFNDTKESIIKIQSTFRMFVERRAYLEKKSAAIKIQAAVRMHILQQKYKKQKQAALVIQKYYRSVLLTRKAKTDYEQVRQSVVMIQSQYRMFVQQKRYTRIKRAATILQAYARGKAVCMEYKRMKHAAFVIQTRYRATLQARQQQLNYQYTKGAIVTIQSAYRGYQARKLARQIRAAVVIQAFYKGCVQRRRYETLKKSAIVVQAVFRGNQTRALLAQRRCQWRAAVCIQRAYRGFTARKQLQVQREARAAQVHRFTSAAFHHLCAMKIQRTYRNYHMRQLAKQWMHSIIYIQQWWRARLERIHYTRLRRGTILLQRAVRHHQMVRNQAAITLQSYARVWLARQYVQKMKTSALKIQCVWRGFKVRRSIKSKKIAAARARCKAANAAATEEKKLCHRTTSALDYLLQYKDLSFILEALMNLDVVTRLSPICCERLVAGQAVPVLYTLIRSCNRSQPCKEVIKYSVSILLNLVKYPKTTHAVFDVPESVTTILDLMQIYRDKGCFIFCQTCLLLGTLSHDPDRAKAIRGMPKITDKIKSIHRLTERKHKMDSKRMEAKNRSLNASRMNSSFLNSSRLNTSVIPGTTLKRRRVAPDWVLGRGRMREIKDPMHASIFLMDALGLLHK